LNGAGIRPNIPEWQRIRAKIRLQPRFPILEQVLSMAAGTNQTAKQLYEFGPFQVDPEKELLLREGEAVPLTPKTFQILLVLIRNRKEVVTKDDLLKAVWPDTFVEEANLSRNIFLLRKALGESPQDHRYVVTVPGRGYRFAEEVQFVPEQPLNIVAASHARVQVEVKESRRWPWLAIAGVVLLALTSGATLFFVHRKPVLTEKDTIVLADFVNSTGEPVFDGALRQGLAVQLEQSPFLSIIPDEKIQQTLGLMGQSADAKLIPAIAREVCQRTASAAVLDGSIARIGTQYLLTLRAVDCESSKTLASTEAKASDENHVLDALGSVSVEIRNKLGESLSTIQKFDTPLEQATTPSLEALKAYSAGTQALRTNGPDAAAPFFKHAVELDPNFAVAYAYLGVMASTTLEPSLSVEYRTKAFELRDRASEAEKYWITATYHKGVTGDIPKAIEACDLWIQDYPRAELPHMYLGAAVLPVVGQNERAVEESVEGIRLRSDYAIGYGFAIRAYTAVNRYGEAKATYAQALERKLHTPFIDRVMYELAFAENDTVGMAQHASKLEALPRFGHQMLSMEGDTAAYSGHLKDARDFNRRAMDDSQRAGERDAPALYAGTSALREAWFGNTGEARRRATLALNLSTGRDLQYFAALAFAYAGDDARAKALADHLDKSYPEDTIVQLNYLPTVRGRLALNKGDASGAILGLGVAVPYELGGTRAIEPKWTAMFPVFVRGEAYLAAHKGSEAAGEFQKVLDHRGLVLNQPIGALAHLGLGRAYALHGDIVKAKTAYQDFLTLWKDADPDIPVLRQAKEEYKKLQ
jgi:DNA-binding winged helix-turn-helix (wHTH) protein/tetratricopeptide (TPR) repeat protein